jgi:hypothetical protein
MENKIVLSNDYNGADILVRVYDNQDEYYKEDEQIVCEVLFKDREPRRAKSWLPKGASNFIAGVLKPLPKEGKTIIISNELPLNVGVLTSCKLNFDNSIKKDLSL